MEMKKRVTVWLMGAKLQPLIEYLNSFGEDREVSREIRRLLQIGFEAEHGGQGRPEPIRRAPVIVPEERRPASLPEPESDAGGIDARLDKMDELF